MFVLFFVLFFFFLFLSIFIRAFIYNLMISGTHLLTHLPSLVISYNEGGRNEVDVGQLLRAPDFLIESVVDSENK